MNERYIAAKERWAAKMAGKAKPQVRSTDRLPPGQHEVRNFPVLDLGVSFPGLQFTNSGATPPDTMGAVGPDHFVEILNANIGNPGIAIFDKCSGALIQRVTNNAFFAVQHQGTNVSLGTVVDSRIVYDPQAQRWVACTLEQAAKAVVLAISQDSNPLY